MPFSGISEFLHRRIRRRAALAAFALPALAALLATATPAHAAAAAPGSTAVTGKTALSGTASTGGRSSAGATSHAAGLSPQAAALAKGTSVQARQQALAAYWTPARMKAARPADVLLPAKHATAGATTTPTGPQGPAARIAPAASTAARGIVQPKAAGPNIVRPSYYSYNPGYPVGSQLAETVGKVYFTLNNTDYACSGSVVNTNGKSIVWTAGHCVISGQTWASNWWFVPNCYSNGSGGCVAPFGWWAAKQFWVPTNYYNNNDNPDDVAAVVIWPNNGWEIANYLGGQGIEWNYPVGQWVSAFGYPGYYGVTLAEADDYIYNSFFSGDGLIYMFNDMAPGSSGGPWLASFNGSFGYIDGHNDWRYNGYSTYMWSPYYGNQVGNLFNTVNNIVG
jgi:hypothetical protein